MLITDKTNKTLFLMIELSQILKRHKCTYDEAEEVISNLEFELKRQREEKEYKTLDDYFKSIKMCDCNSEIITGWDHFEIEVEGI